MLCFCGAGAPARPGNITSGNGIGGVLLYRVLNSTQGLQAQSSTAASRVSPPAAARDATRTSCRAPGDLQDYCRELQGSQLTCSQRPALRFEGMPLPPGVERESVPSLPASRPTHHASQLVSDNLDSSGRSAAACSNVAPHRPDGHKCEAVGGRIWSLALGGAVRTAYGLRLKLTNENPHKKLVSLRLPQSSQLRGQGASSAGFTFSFLATICDTRASLASRARPRRLGSRIALSNLPGKPARHH